MPRIRKSIAFKGVSFSYSGDPKIPALTEISTVIPARKLTALVGPSGAGKSTMVDLIPRLISPSAGQILFDGTQQSDFNLASLRREISFAPQQAQLFNVTIEEHIRYGKPDATRKEIEEAARIAQARDFIAQLPQGYATLTGEDGRNLSGGQRQRLDLARAIIRGSSILILDEPTANLDADSAALFFQALEVIRKETETTIIMIGHNLSSIKTADQIIVLNRGRLEDSGSHDELIARDNWYSNMLQDQSNSGKRIRKNKIKIRAN